MINDRRRAKPSWAVFGLVLVGGFIMAGVGRGGGRINGDIKPFLQRDLESYHDLTTRYSYAYVSLHDDAKDAVVYITGDGWCGSGGCTALILERNGPSFRVVQKLSLARLPIYVLPTRTKGWHDMAMPVAGGGVVSGYIGLLRFNGKKYWPVAPSSKSQVPPKGAAPLRLMRVGSLLYP